MHVLVFGATGIQGRHQVHALAHAGHTVVAISRNPPDAASTTFPPTLSATTTSIQTHALDYTSPSAQTSLTSLLHQHAPDRIFLNLPSTSFTPAGPLLRATQTIAQCTKSSNVPLVVFNTSMPIAASPAGIKAQEDRRSMRDSLRSYGVPVVSIEPVVYLDNLLEGWALGPLRDEGRLVYCHREGLRVSWVCHHDVARIMVAVMGREPGVVAGRNIRVGGPETVVLSELTARLARAWGRPLRCENQSVEEFCERISGVMRGRGLDGEVVVRQMFTAYTYYNEAEEEPFRVDMRGLVEELGIRLTTIEEWAARRSPWEDKGYF
ncbi:NAD(P)-binding protein [Decorospora gaudefroyi]|uniref:NAD(P)-binding protein n=1 Tax=Decorospora gaudefroyi TaxID=184978 RepID=A0A6A5KRW0_9PLEO|nr:NAD(P)-binding protein [Decorospora gaudefroyi]